MKEILKQLNSKKLTVEDKHKIINKEYSCPKMQRHQRDYVLICADRATIDSTPEIKEFFLLCALINISEMFELRGSSACSSAYRSACRSAECSTECSTEWSTERLLQIEIFKSVLTGECWE